MTQTPLSQTTIYKESTGDPLPYLQAIAGTGFSHIHWSHQWYTDYLYAGVEIVQIQRWLKDLNLQVLDIHASHGIEKSWCSTEPYQRLAGVELVRNRLELANRLEARAIVVHAFPDKSLEAQLTSLSELEPYARLLGVKITVENFSDTVSHDHLAKLFDAFDPAFLGLCYDTGHGNMNDAGLDFLETWKHRLDILHIHDNDGSGDQHKLPFTGTVDWERFIRILDSSAYTGPINLECTASHHDDLTDTEFLQASHQAGMRLQSMRHKASES